MKDLEIDLANRPGALAEMGEALGRAGVSVEGGGVFASGAAGIAHFLVADAVAARAALDAAGVRGVRENEVVTVRMRQDEPGQLGTLARRMASAGVNIEVQYSDHAGNLVLVADDSERARDVAAEWTRDAGGA
jgi:hypothetical protein